MSDRRVVVELKIKVIMDIEEGVSVDNIVSDLDYNIDFSGEEASIIDTEITDFAVLDSR